DISPHERWIATGGEGVRVWDVTSGLVLRNVRLDSGVKHVRFAPAGHTLVIARPGAFTRYAVETGTASPPRAAVTWLSVSATPVVRYTALASSADGRFLAAAAQQSMDLRAGHVVRLWDVATGTEHDLAHEGGPTSVMFAPDDTLFVGGYRSLSQWNPHTATRD